MNKMIYMVLFCFSLCFSGQTQSAGDLLFVGLFTDSPQAFAFVVVNPLPGNTKIYFTDDEWNGLPIGGGGEFNSRNEGYVEWTTPASGVSSGTIVKVQDGRDANDLADDVVNIGNITETDRNLLLKGHDEGLYAYIGNNVNTPTAFIAAIFNSRTTDSENSIDGTGLTLGLNAFQFVPDGIEDGDGGVFDFANSSCSITGLTPTCLDEIRDLNNWIFENGDEDIISIADVPTQLILPVDFISFTAKPTDETVELSWQTAFEINNDYMAIERSKNGKDFTEIGYVLGAGTTAEKQQYYFTDDNPLEGIIYYRLRQVDFDGTVAYSDIVKVSMESLDSDLSIYPNPTLDYISLPELKADATVRVFNAQGQLLFLTQINDRQELSLDHLPKGLYMIQSEDKGEVKIGRVFKM